MLAHLYSAPPPRAVRSTVSAGGSVDARVAALGARQPRSTKRRLGRRPGPRRGAPHSCRTEGRPSVDLGCGSRSWDKSSRSWATPPSKWMDGDGRDGPSIQLDSILSRDARPERERPPKSVRRSRWHPATRASSSTVLSATVSNDDESDDRRCAARISLSRVEVRDLRQPEAVVTYPLGVTHQVRLAGTVVSRHVLPPGWSWEKHAQPHVGTASC